MACVGLFLRGLDAIVLEMLEILFQCLAAAVSSFTQLGVDVQVVH